MVSKSAEAMLVVNCGGGPGNPIGAAGGSGDGGDGPPRRRSPRDHRPDFDPTQRYEPDDDDDDYDPALPLRFLLIHVQEAHVRIQYTYDRRGPAW